MHTASNAGHSCTAAHCCLISGALSQKSLVKMRSTCAGAGAVCCRGGSRCSRRCGSAPPGVPVFQSRPCCGSLPKLRACALPCGLPLVINPLSQPLCVLNNTCAAQVYAAPIVFERNAYDVPVFTRVHDFMWSGAARLAATHCRAPK